MPAPEARGDVVAERLLAFVVADFIFAMVFWHHSFIASLTWQSLHSPMADSACLSAFFVYLGLPPRRREQALLVALAVGVEVLLSRLRGPQTPLWTVTQLGPGFFLAALIGFGLRVATTRDAVRRDILGRFAMALCIPMFYLVGGFTFVGHSLPVVYDLYAYAIDGGGGPPSFWIAHIVEHHPWLYTLIGAVYFELPLAMVIARQFTRGHARRSYNDVLMAFFVLVVVGCQIYCICPMVGPRVLVGRQYPDCPPPPIVGAPHPVSAPYWAERNCMPSLHLAWALAILWGTMRVSRRARVLGLLYLGLTLIATRSFGDHYLVDLVAAFPFALAAQGVTARRNPESLQHRQTAMIAGGSMTALVVIGLLEYNPLLIAHPIIPNLSSVIIVGASIWLEHRLAVAAMPDSLARGRKAPGARSEGRLPRPKKPGG